jgi:putative ABC transport system ATP-binding protein
MNDGMAGSTPAVEVVDLAKTFDRGAIHALDGVSFSVAAGEWVALTGPSGCGKSTLLHLIAALDTPGRGYIAVGGRRLDERDDLDRFRRNEVGLIFQLHNLLPNLTAAQNVEVAMLGSGKSHREMKETALALLGEMGLSGRARVRPPALSGGERQRVAIARALANGPGLLLADEPTGSLDTAAAMSVLDTLHRLRQERHLTILFVTHDMEVAAHADRILHMRDGRIVNGVPDAEGAPALTTTGHQGPDLRPLPAPS